MFAIYPQRFRFCEPHFSTCVSTTDHNSLTTVADKFTFLQPQRFTSLQFSRSAIFPDNRFQPRRRRSPPLHIPKPYSQDLGFLLIFNIVTVSIMNERKDKRKKGTITPEDGSTLLERYSVRTILTLLREVAQASEGRIDWDKLLKNTSTGISSAREYRLLWRHLAYRHALMEKMDRVTDPLDDDSDLDFEIEAFPSVSNESSNEAAACVKVLIANGIPSESDILSSSEVEAPLTIGISNSQSSSRGNLENPQASSLMQGVYVRIPISIQRQPISTPSATEVLDVNGAAGSNAASRRRRRRPWTKAEDTDLIAAVKKYGEGNWANILMKENFKEDRTALQLSQRWSVIRKRSSNLNVGANAASTQISKAKIDAAHHALSLALDLPVNNLKTVNSNINTCIVSPASGVEAPVQMQNQSSQIPKPSRPVLVEPLSSAANSRINSSKNSLMTKSIHISHSSDAIVRATAVAAGARIVSLSDAASLLTATQTKNAIHIKSNGASIKSPVLGNAPMHSDARSNVHCISMGKTATPGSNYMGGKSTVVGNNSMKAVLPKVLHNRSTAGLTKPPTEQIDRATKLSPLEQEIKSLEESKILKPIITAKEKFRENEAMLRDISASRESGRELGSP